MSEWISVKDKQPDKDANYLVYWSDGEIYVLDYFIHENAQGWNYSPTEINSNVTVLAWMPLPEAPKPDTL